MDNSYFTEGYNLMMKYLKENKILTKERNFRNRLERWYNKNKDKTILSLTEEREYLQLEKYFFNNILSPSNSHEQALTNTLNILADVDLKDIDKE